MIDTQTKTNKKQGSSTATGARPRTAPQQGGPTTLGPGSPPTCRRRIVPTTGFVAHGTVAAILGGAGPQLSNHGGKVLGAVEVVPIYWGSAWTSGANATLATQVDAFFDFILTSKMMDLLSEYSTGSTQIGHGSRLTSVKVSDFEPGTVTPNGLQVTDAQIQQALQGWINNKTVPAVTANTLYFIYLPPNVSCIGPDNEVSCTGMCGYHDAIGSNIYYAVIPYVTCNGCVFPGNFLDTLTEISSHELSEAITDPTLGTWWDSNTGSEIGDICNRNTTRLGGYLIQTEWSNSQNACVITPASGWLHNDLTAAAGAPTTIDDPRAQGTQHVNYRGPDNHIHELWWDNIGCHHNNLTAAAAGAPIASGDPRGYVNIPQGTLHVNYRGPDNHIHELWWDNKRWRHNDLTGAAAGAPVAASEPRGYMFDAQRTQHVNYRGPDNHIHELWWDSNGWHHNDLSASATGAPNTVGEPFGYVFAPQGTQHVNYRGTDNHVHELWWDNHGWHHNDLTAAAAGAPNAIGDPYGYMFAAQGTQHVNYRGTDNHVHELWWDNHGWHHTDLTAAAAAPNTAGDPFGYMNNSQGTQHVNYLGIDGHIHELWWKDNGWHHTDLTVAATGAPNSAGDPHGYVFAAQNTHHVNYRGTDGHVHELWRS